MSIKIEKIDDFTKNSKYPPTKRQWQAIGLNGVDVLVAAAAGSGKTAVLSERISKKVADDNWDIDKILVLTFTKAAAKNMRDRIEKKIEERLLYKNTPEANAHLKRQRLLINKAYISTIDSFCLALLKKFYYLVEEEVKGKVRGLSPNFKILANNEYILKSSIESVVESYSKDRKDDFRFLFNLFTDKQNKNVLVPYLKDTYNKMLSIPNYKEYIKTDLFKTIDIILGEFSLENECNTILKVSESKDIDEIKNNKTKLKEEIRFLKEYFEKQNFSEKIKNLKTEFGVEIDIDDLENPYNKVRDCDEKINNFSKDDILKLPESLSKLKGEINSLNKLYLIRDLIVNILLDIDEEFIFRKREGKFLDFADMNHLAINVLQSENSEAREYYKNLFLEIYVDEYQDNNDLQEHILNLIRGENTFFFRVGDVKQSIYGFRASNPELFEKKYNEYTKIDKYVDINNYDIEKEYSLEEKPEGICVVLSENFRSKENVLQSSNYIFNRLMCKHGAGISYDESSVLNYPTVKKESKEISILNLIENYQKENKSSTEILTGIEDVEKQFQKDENGNEESEYGKLLNEELSNIEKIEKIISYCKNKIATEIIKSSTKHNNRKKDEVFEQVALEIQRRVANEKINYSDFAILVRRATKMDEYKKVLEKYKIPVYYKEKNGFTKSNVFNILYNLLRFLDDQDFDIGLLILLRSEIGGFSNEDLARLSLEKGETLYEKLQVFHIQKAKFINNLLKDWLNYSYNNSAYNVIKKVSWDIELLEYLRKFDVDDTEIDYYHNFLDIVSETSNESINLSHTIKRLAEIKENEEYEAERSGNQNSVVMSTIHNSKGLEYKNVFVVELHKEFNDNDYSEKIIYSKQLGLTANLKEIGGIEENNVLQKFYEINASLIRRKNIEEEIRNLYVALTRAENKLYLVTNSSIKNGESIEKVGNEKECIATKLKGNTNKKLQKNTNEKSKENTNEKLSYHYMLKLIFENYSDEKMQNNTNSSENKALFNDFEFIEIPEVTTDETPGVNVSENDFDKEIEKYSLNFLNIKKEREQNFYPSKTSYSMLKKINESKENKNIEQNDINKDYLLLETINNKNKLVDAIFKGNLIHKLFEKIVYDIKQGTEIKNISSYLKKIVKSNDKYKNIKEGKILSQEEYNCLNNEDDITKILNFVNLISPILKNSIKTETEITFTNMGDVSEFFTSAKDSTEQGDVILQGVVDLLIEQDDKYLLIDYKTDRVFGQNARESLKKRHQKQLMIYSDAVKKYYGDKKNIQKFIYSYSLSELIEL